MVGLWAALLAVLVAVLVRLAARAKGRHVALVRLEGTIGLGRGGVSALGAVTELASARRDARAAALLLRIDSPGGAVGATEEIAREVERFRATGRPVVASVGNHALSGGFWLAMAADVVVAPEGALLGSIGVVVQKPELSRLLDRLGIGVEVAKKPEHKDFMSPHRPWEPEERALLEAIDEEIYQVFVDHVASRRRLPRSSVLEVADGRIFTGRQGKALGFVDELGNFEDALRLARARAGLPEGAAVRSYRRGLTSLFGLGFPL